MNQLNWFQVPFKLFERFPLLFHRQAPPNQMPPNHFMQNPQTTGPNPWWNHPNRYAHSMGGGMHQKDNIKPNESGILNAFHLHIVCDEKKNEFSCQIYQFFHNLFQRNASTSTNESNASSIIWANATSRTTTNAASRLCTNAASRTTTNTSPAGDASR